MKKLVIAIILIVAASMPLFGLKRQPLARSGGVDPADTEALKSLNTEYNPVTGKFKIFYEDEKDGSRKWLVVRPPNMGRMTFTAKVECGDNGKVFKYQYIAASADGNRDDLRVIFIQNLSIVSNWVQPDHWKEEGAVRSGKSPLWTWMNMEPRAYDESPSFSFEYHFSFESNDPPGLARVELAFVDYYEDTFDYGEGGPVDTWYPRDMLRGKGIIGSTLGPIPPEKDLGALVKRLKDEVNECVSLGFLEKGQITNEIVSRLDEVASAVRGATRGEKSVKSIDDLVKFVEAVSQDSMLEEARGLLTGNLCYLRRRILTGEESSLTFPLPKILPYPEKSKLTEKEQWVSWLITLTSEVIARAPDQESKHARFELKGRGIDLLYVVRGAKARGTVPEVMQKYFDDIDQFEKDGKLSKEEARVLREAGLLVKKAL